MGDIAKISSRTIIYKLFCLLLFTGQSDCQNKPARKQIVSTVLNAKWSSTPFALETAEFLADVKDDYFWAYLDFLAEDEIVHRKLTDEEFYDKLMTFSSRYGNL